MKAEPIHEYVLGPHAAFELARRGIGEEIVRWVLEAPEQRLQVRPGRDVLQSRLTLQPEGKTYLIRVFVDVDREPTEVVTAYRTSRIDKYWRQER
jgi:hypothetical protein